MSDPLPADSAHAVAIFDLDGTITRFDTLVPYLIGVVARTPSRWWRLLRLPPAILRYVFGHRDRGALKGALVHHLLSGLTEADIEHWNKRYLDWLWRRGLYPKALETLERHRAAGEHLVLLSASVTLYVPAIAARLGMHEVICTGVRWQDGRVDGRLTTPNRRGEEKLACVQALRERLRPSVVSAYGNAASDLPHLVQVEQPLLVNGSSSARRAAAALGVPVADWR